MYVKEDCRNSMRILSSTAGEQLRLRLVQETSQQLTFQRGILSKSQAIGQGWRNSRFGLVELAILCILILSSMWRGGVFHSISSNPISINLFMLFWGMGMFGIPLVIVAYRLLSACFVSWTFDRSERTLRREGVNILSQKRTKIYRFDEIEKIGVDRGKDSDDNYIKCCKLYITLRSGKEVTLSQSCYTRDRHEHAIALQYHQEIAEKMRTCLGQTTAETERADRVWIPDAQDIAADRAAEWDMLKLLAGGLFSSKEKRQSEIENIKEKLITERDNARLWEQLSWHLAMHKEHYRESIEALSHAETIYRDRGNIVKADDLATKIALFEAKI
jgi:hypothetical protein